MRKTILLECGRHTIERSFKDDDNVMVDQAKVWLGSAVKGVYKYRLHEVSENYFIAEKL